MGMSFSIIFLSIPSNFHKFKNFITFIIIKRFDLSTSTFFSINVVRDNKKKTVNRRNMRKRFDIVTNLRT